MRPWHIGNTTIRSPFRLRDGLIALSGSSLLGDIKGREKETAFAWLLHQAEVVALGRSVDDDVSDLGRKWRAALTQLGFIVPELNIRDQSLDQAWIGRPFTLTENGRRLVSSEAVPAMQECFLRALAAYRIPSTLEMDYEVSQFSPLRYVLAIMLDLEHRTGSTHLNFLEMAVIVQLSSPDDDLNEVVSRILRLREERDAAPNVRRFDTQEYEVAALQNDRAASTFRDYADLNFRYLKATGLIHSSGRGISIVPEKRLLAVQLVSQPLEPMSDEQYLRQLCSGASLPTDNAESAAALLDELLASARTRGIDFQVSGRALDSAADIATARYELEELIAEDKETAFAAEQAGAIEEILAYMRLITQRGGSAHLADGTTISVPKSEVPAYFEWVLWRAFLAIDSLVNKPYEARRFKVDQDFLPIGCAPGGGPDLIFEFDEFVLVVEVTMTESSRQEAAEGEPVRRHVADILQGHNPAGNGKPVYGLFLANRIDSNTAETFRIGVWYLPDDSRTRLDIVPVTLASFQEFFGAICHEPCRDGHQVLREALDESISLRNECESAPEWRTRVDQVVRAYAR